MKKPGPHYHKQRRRKNISKTPNFVKFFLLATLALILPFTNQFKIWILRHPGSQFLSTFLLVQTMVGPIIFHLLYQIPYKFITKYSLPCKLSRTKQKLGQTFEGYRFGKLDFGPSRKISPQGTTPRTCKVLYIEKVLSQLFYIQRHILIHRQSCLKIVNIHKEHSRR